MFRPFEENRIPSHIIQDDVEDLPLDLYMKPIEIPNINIKLAEEMTCTNLYLVPEKFKRKVMLDKKFKNKEKVGEIDINLDHIENDVEEFDDFEQIFNVSTMACKYKYMYGLTDFRILKVYQLKSGELLVEIPEFKNYLMYNLLAEELVSKFQPQKFHLFVENATEESPSSDEIKSSLLSGRFRNPGGELGLRSVNAAIINKLDSLDSVQFENIPRDQDTLSTLYI